jgi:2-amino-4-hydroxy-6-hydroxymethyldihydropteridine diphosphokinase
MALAYLSLGSNLGNKNENLANAKFGINQSGIQIKRESSIYQTEPWGFNNPEIFFNQVLEIDTLLKPDQLLKRLQFLEKKLGRVKKSKGYESRIIDIDILLYADEIIQQEDISVPHPLLHLRKFALIPLCELAPSLIHPVLKKEIRELLKECKDTGKVWLNKKIV